MILVTGGDGFIGKQVCSLLSQYGHDIIATDRHFASPVPYPSETGDLADGIFLAALFEKYTFDAIVHLASLLNTASSQYPQAAMQINIGVSLSLLELAAQFGIAKFVYGSSITVYGPQPFPDHGPVSETEPAAPKNVYGLSKRYVEVVGEAWRRRTDLRFVALRIAAVVGPGAKSPTSIWRSALFEALTTRQPMTIYIPYRSGETIPLVHVEDVAEMIRLLVEAKQSTYTIYNTPSESWRLDELAEYIKKLNKYIQFTYGNSLVDDIPPKINGQRFIEEFGYQAIPLISKIKCQI